MLGTPDISLKIDKEQVSAVTLLTGSSSQRKLKGDGRREPQDSAKGRKPGSHILKMSHLMELSYLVRGLYTEVRCLSSVRNKL